MVGTHLRCLLLETERKMQQGGRTFDPGKQTAVSHSELLAKHQYMDSTGFGKDVGFMQHAFAISQTIAQWIVLALFMSA
jgi:hypothetical protein